VHLGQRAVVAAWVSGVAAIAPGHAIAWVAPPAGVEWSDASHSPQPGVASGIDQELLAECGEGDLALFAIARLNIERQLSNVPLLPSDELVFNLRAAGEPHVWPRGWAISGLDLDPVETADRLMTWASRNEPLGVRRCGVARGLRSDGIEVVSVVAVDALADLDPLPTSARIGQWISLKATMLVPATNAKVVLLGPRGAPRTVVASLTDDTIRSSFSVDQPGPWLVQVLADVSTGPRPVLEAYIHAGTPPPARFVRLSAPGEAAAKGAPDEPAELLAMMNEARHLEGLERLARDPDLDELALEHVRAMKEARVVGHDVGAGTPTTRLEAAGVRARFAGENVASAESLIKAHRALWASPSHRGNLLHERFRRVGVAVLRDERARVWTAQIFAD
jgi:uncharacterized protein YkwD